MSETNDTSGHVDPATEEAVHAAMADIRRPASTEEKPAHPSAAVVDAVFLTHFNSPPIACEALMRPIIEAARKDLKTSLAAI